MIAVSHCFFYGCPVPVVLLKLSCLAVISWLCCPCCGPVSLSCLGCSVSVVLFWLYCSGCPVSVSLSCPGCYVPVVLFWLSCPDFPGTVALCCLSYPSWLPSISHAMTKAQMLLDYYSIFLSDDF
jgi:hypothetical protein